MSPEPVASSDGPGRRRPSWNLKAIVEDVGGRPIAEFQDPDRPTHPYLQGRSGSVPLGRSATRPEELPEDPVGRVYPPLVGPTGRSLHGREAEHHPPTLASVASEPDASVGRAVHPPGPSHRPERIYLHYLLLHLDRLNDTALTYLHQAVLEERQHRWGRVLAPEPSGPEPAPSGSPPPAG